MGVSKNMGETSKMDGENNGKPNPMNKWDDCFFFPLFFGLTPIYIYIEYIYICIIYQHLPPPGCQLNPQGLRDDF